MSYTWHFYTQTRRLNPIGRRCHRGPMIDVEVVMSTPFRYLGHFNLLRKRLLDSITDSTLLAVQTREVVLRSLNTLLGPMFARLAPRKKSLQALICEKRTSPVVLASLSDSLYFYPAAAKELVSYGVPSQQVDLLVAALESSSPIMQVAGQCATVLLMSFIEMDYQNG